MLDLTVEILHLVISGPSTHKTDEFGEDLRYRKSQDMDAAPRRRDILNCRKRNRNETKKGIKIKFFPLENGQPKEFITPEELDKISNDIATQLSPKFVKYKLELDRDGDAPEKNAAAFMVPLDSFVAFLQAFVLKA
jgi:hypothetical protein